MSDEHKQEDADKEAYEEAVAEAIEEAVGDAPASIEEEQLLEAAELEEIQAHVDTAIEEADDAVDRAEGALATGRADELTRKAIAEAEAEIDDAEEELEEADEEVEEGLADGTLTAEDAVRLEEEIDEAEEIVEAADDEVEEIAEIIEERRRALELAPQLVEVAAVHPRVRLEAVHYRSGPAQAVAHVGPAELVPFLTAVHNAGFDMFIDLCGVDYLRRRPRFEVVINLLSVRYRQRLRVRVPVGGDEPTVPSIVSIYPGANFYERETYDLFGITFDGHPDLTRILLPDDWEGFPLRKDYAVGSVPVQFKEAHKAT